MNFESNWKLACDSIGEGEDVVFVHGAIAPGIAAFPAQLGLANRYRLHFLHRRGYEPNPYDGPEDFEVDGLLLASSLKGARAHLVGHSYGSLVTMHAAAARPESVLSLTLIEPVLFSAGEHNHLVAGLLADLKAVFNDDGLSLRDFIVAFGGAIGLNLSKLPEPEGALRRHAGLLRGQRPPWDCDPSVLEPLRRLSAPKLVINGGRSNAMCALGDLLAQEVGAGHAVLETHGHDVQRVGTWINPLLMSLFNTEVI